jgi:hypothetical protein
MSAGSALGGKMWPQVGDRMQPLPTPVSPGQQPSKSIFARTLEEGQLALAKDWLLTVEAAKALTAPRVRWDVNAWRRRLEWAHYPYAERVLAVLNGIGCDIDPNPDAGIGPRVALPNHPSALVFRTQVREAIEKELAAGYVVEWKRRDVLPWFILPVGAVAKFAQYEDEQVYERALLRASARLSAFARQEFEATLQGGPVPSSVPSIGQFPQPESVRLLFDGRQGPNSRALARRFGMETFRAFVRELQRGDYTWAEDLKGAFRNGELPKEQWIMAGFMFEGRVMVYARLPFGANQSPVEYMAYFGSPLHYMLVHELRERGVPGCVFLWVDDFFGAGPSRAVATVQRDCFVALCDELGVKRAADKAKDVAQENVLMGYIVKTWPNVSVSLPGRKLAKIWAVANDILARGWAVPARLAMRLMGCVNHAAVAIAGAEVYSAEVVRTLRGLKVDSVFHPSVAFVEDLRFFREEAARWNGVEVVAVEPSFPRGLHAASDAAGAGALAVALFGVVFVWNTPLELEGAMIQLKELLAAVMMDVMLAALMGQCQDAREGGTSGWETRVLVSGRIDNQNCLAWFAKGRTGSELGNRLLRFHWRAMMSRRMRVQHEYVASGDNMLADAGSRRDRDLLSRGLEVYINSLPRDRPDWWPGWAPFPPQRDRGFVEAGHVNGLGVLGERICGFDASQEDGGVGQVEGVLHELERAACNAMAAQ